MKPFYFLGKSFKPQRYDFFRNLPKFAVTLVIIFTFNFFMKYHIQIFISMTLFALSFVWSKQALEFMTPAILITLRVVIATVIVGGFALSTGKMEKVRGGDLWFLLLLAISEPVGYFLFENAGVALVSPTLACLVIGIIPVLTPFAAYFINGERISVYSWVGLFISFVGVVVVVLSEGMSMLSGNLSGIMYLFGAVGCSIVYYVMLQRISQKFSSYTIVCYINLFSIVFLVPIILLFDFGALVSLGTSVGGWLYPVLMLGVLCSSVAFILNTNGIRALGVTVTTMYINLMPGITAIFSYILLGEEITTIKVAGILITIFGLFIANFKKR